jgi:hypothetical protein
LDPFGGKTQSIPIKRHNYNGLADLQSRAWVDCKCVLGVQALQSNWYPPSKEMDFQESRIAGLWKIRKCDFFPAVSVFLGLDIA